MKKRKDPRDWEGPGRAAVAILVARLSGLIDIELERSVIYCGESWAGYETSVTYERNDHMVGSPVHISRPGTWGLPNGYVVVECPLWLGRVLHELYRQRGHAVEVRKVRREYHRMPEIMTALIVYPKR